MKTGLVFIRETCCVACRECFADERGVTAVVSSGGGGAGGTTKSSILTRGAACFWYSIGIGIVSEGSEGFICMTEGRTGGRGREWRRQPPHAKAANVTQCRGLGVYQDGQFGEYDLSRF